MATFVARYPIVGCGIGFDGCDDYSFWPYASGWLGGWSCGGVGLYSYDLVVALYSSSGEFRNVARPCGGG